MDESTLESPGILLQESDLLLAKIVWNGRHVSSVKLHKDLVEIVSQLEIRMVSGDILSPKVYTQASAGLR